MQRSSDVVIVGAGPAGSVTALLLARAGHDVVLFDARHFPRPKPCGDCISPGANQLLRGFGLWQQVLAAQPAMLTGWRLAAGPGAFSAGFGDELSLALPREKLDAVLLDAARAAGVDVRTGVRVQQLLRHNDAVTGVIADSTPVRARLTVGADGLRSRTARLLRAYRRAPRVRKLSLTAHLRGVTHAARIGEMNVHADACLGIAPVENSAHPLCNVTVVLQAGTQTGRGRQEMMRNALRTMQRADIANLIGDDEPIMASGPFDWPVRRVVFDGAALVGDAAGYFDPFTGQGIYQALAGAQLLAEVAHDALRSVRVDRKALAPYAAAHHSLVTATHRVQHVVDYVCAHPRLSARLFDALARTPELAARLVAVTGDMQPARVLFSPALLMRFMAASVKSARR